MNVVFDLPRVREFVRVAVRDARQGGRALAGVLFARRRIRRGTAVPHGLRTTRFARLPEGLAAVVEQARHDLGKPDRVLAGHLARHARSGQDRLAARRLGVVLRTLGARHLQHVRAGPVAEAEVVRVRVAVAAVRRRLARRCDAVAVDRAYLVVRALPEEVFALPVGSADRL